MPVQASLGAVISLLVMMRFNLLRSGWDSSDKQVRHHSRRRGRDPRRLQERVAVEFAGSQAGRHHKVIAAVFPRAADLAEQKPVNRIEPPDRRNRNLQPAQP